MSMHESEARTKWCPFARLNLEYEPVGSFNRNGGDYNCLGRECMVWVMDHLGGPEWGSCGLAKRYHKGE